MAKQQKKIKNKNVLTNSSSWAYVSKYPTWSDGANSHEKHVKKKKDWFPIVFLMQAY